MEAYQRLESEYAEFCGNPNMVVCSSGTAALHLSLETLSVTEGWYREGKETSPSELTNVFGSVCRADEPLRVVIPDFAMIACARAITLAGMTPEFTDVDELGLLSECPLSATAVMVVHTYGRKAYNDFMCSVIEDLAEAHGIQPNPNSLAACWSFYKNKVIAGEEGGMIAFKTDEQAALAKKLRNMGFEDGQSFWHMPRGMNYRLSNCHAELILHSLHNYEGNIDRRKHVEGYYDIYCPEEWRLPKRDIPWVYDLDLPVGVDVDTVVKNMNEIGTEARCGFKPLSQQKEYSRLECERWSEPGEAMLDGVPYSKNPVANRLSRTRMYLPIEPWMAGTANLIRRVMETLREIVGVHEKSPI